MDGHANVASYIGKGLPLIFIDTRKREPFKISTDTTPTAFLESVKKEALQTNRELSAVGKYDGYDSCLVSFLHSQLQRWMHMQKSNKKSDGTKDDRSLWKEISRQECRSPF